MTRRFPLNIPVFSTAPHLQLCFVSMCQTPLLPLLQRGNPQPFLGRGQIVTWPCTGEGSHSLMLLIQTFNQPSCFFFFIPIYTSSSEVPLIPELFKILNIHSFPSLWLSTIGSLDFSFSCSKLGTTHSSAFQFPKLCCHLASALGSFPVLSMQSF